MLGTFICWFTLYNIIRTVFLHLIHVGNEDSKGKDVT